MLHQMITCGREFERRVQHGQPYPFANMVSAMREMHRGTHRPYPCGAGAGYAGVAADGSLAACHRFVANPDGFMGTLIDGVDRLRQERWLSTRHVHRQEPCRSCWARYLCGGGCHHEVMQRGRLACGYIRGWLHYCLQAYVRLLEECPEYFASEDEG
ncbi:MAG: SPASM domain-containing protein [Candidatus Tectimicrobiota bacterium]